MGSSLLTKRSSDLELHLYHGCGNRFFIFDARSHSFPIGLIPHLCEQYSLDGTILLKESKTADHKMVIYNADGLEAEMCGNGLRCLMQFLVDRGAPQKLSFETLDGLYSCQVTDDEISIRMRAPKKVQWEMPLTLGGKEFNAAYLQQGVPHLILFFEEVESSHLLDLYEECQENTSVFPKGVNVSGVQILPNHTFLIQTAERGVGRVTGACGTGAVAAALAISKRFGFPSPLTAIPPSKESMTIFFSWEGEKPWGIHLRGPAQRELVLNFTTPYNAQL